jgi:hypothetical protein
MATDQPPPRAPIRVLPHMPVVIDRTPQLGAPTVVSVYLGQDARDLHDAVEDDGDAVEPTLEMTAETADRLVAALLRGPMGPPGVMGPMGAKGDPA